MTEVVKEALIIEPDLSATPSCGHTALCLYRFESRIRFGMFDRADRLRPTGCTCARLPGLDRPSDALSPRYA
ncbi:MAG: hypothetical protein ACJA07_002989 [Rhodococcus sp. (in: high G+C Gram-positive bacteria)]